MSNLDMVLKLHPAHKKKARNDYTFFCEGMVPQRVTGFQKKYLQMFMPYPRGCSSGLFHTILGSFIGTIHLKPFISSCLFFFPDSLRQTRGLFTP